MKHDPAFGADEAQAGGGSLLSHIPAILWQRKWLMVVPLVVCSIAGVAAAFLLPVQYRSTATLLVQSGALPAAVAGDDQSNAVERRLASIREQVLSRPGLIELINKYELYAKERSRKALSDVIDNMRESIAMAPQGSEVKTPTGSTTVAVSLGYTYGDPVKAQAVTQDLVEQVLLLDATGNTEQAKSAVQFLTDQQRGVQDQISQLESQIAAVKRENAGVLAAGTGMVQNGGGLGYDLQIAALQRENTQLVTSRETVKQGDRDPGVTDAETRLARLQATYSDDHPDVKLAKAQLDEARSLAKRNIAKLPMQSVDQQVDYNNRQIAMLREAQGSERARVSASLGAQARAPLVLDQIAQYQQKVDGLYTQFRGISDRLLQARAGVKAENEQLGERLAVVDPPVVPDEPVFPNRLLFSAGGVAAGLALGLVLIGLVELLKRPIRDPASLTAFFGETPLGVIPTIAASKASRPRGFLARLFRRRARRAADEPAAA